jgi:hypothetical protein
VVCRNSVGSTTYATVGTLAGTAKHMLEYFTQLYWQQFDAYQKHRYPAAWIAFFDSE